MSLSDYIAGLTDGEGHFSLYITRDCNPKFEFRITLRDDDAAVLQSVAEELGFGSLVRARPPKGTRGGEASYRVRTLHECLTLCQYFEEHPLRSKKAKEFTLWSKALRLWVDKRQAAMPEIANIAREIRRIRTYTGAPTQYQKWVQDSQKARADRRCDRVQKQQQVVQLAQHLATLLGPSRVAQLLGVVPDRLDKWFRGVSGPRYPHIALERLVRHAGVLNSHPLRQVLMALENLPDQRAYTEPINLPCGLTGAIRQGRTPQSTRKLGLLRIWRRVVRNGPEVWASSDGPPLVFITSDQLDALLKAHGL